MKKYGSIPLKLIFICLMINMTTIDFTKDNSIEIKTIKNKYLQKIFIFIFKIIKITINYIHIFLDRVVAFSFYIIIKLIWEFVYYIEKYLFEYLKNSKYIENDKFNPKISREKLIMLWMWMQDTKTITIREVANELWVSDWYARRIKEIAKEPMKYYYEYKSIMKNYQSDSEKRDKRSFISDSDFKRYDHC